jgi:glutamine---fructose-6-phosphate transaminase (isomerizing)
MKRCSKCILTERAVPIGSDGVCMYCHEDIGGITYFGEKALVEILERNRIGARERGASYDCIVPVSGGRDSMYALYALVKKYKMKPLAFNYNQGFVEPQATANIENAIRILGVDLIRNTDNKAQHQYTRHNLSVLSKARPQQRRLVELLCAGCDAGYVDIVDELARQHKVSLIVQGGCGFEPHLRGYLTSDVRLISSSPALSLMVEEMKELLNNLGLFIDPRYPLNRRFLCHVPGFMSRFLPKRHRKGEIERIHFFKYITWKYREDVAELEREIEWRKPPGMSTTMRFDCRLHILVDRYRILYQGFSEKEAVLSALVRAKVITREEALREAQKEMAEDEQLVDRVIAEVAGTIGAEDRLPEIRRLFHPPNVDA